jgi:hypothetical protein
MRRIRLVLLAILLLTGCVPYADTPLTDPGEQELDTAIMGTWYWKEAGNRGYLHIGREEDSGLLRCFLMDFDDDGELDLSAYEGHTSQLGGKRYLNVRVVGDNGKAAGGYLLVRYDVRPDALGLHVMESEPVKKAITAGTLEGVEKKQEGDWVGTLHITADREKLQAFVLENDAVLFSELKYMPRLNLPDMPPQYRTGSD